MEAYDSGIESQLRDTRVDNVSSSSYSGDAMDLSLSAWNNIQDTRNNRPANFLDINAKSSVQDHSGNTVTLDTLTGKLVTRDNNGNTIDYESMQESDRASTRNATTAGTVFLGSPVAFLGMGAAMTVADHSQEQDHLAENNRLSAQLDPRSAQRMDALAGLQFDRQSGQQLDPRTGRQFDPGSVQQFDPRDPRGQQLESFQQGQVKHGLDNSANANDNLNGNHDSFIQKWKGTSHAAGTDQSQAFQQQSMRIARGYSSDVIAMAMSQANERRSGKLDAYGLAGLVPELFVNQRMIERNAHMREDDRISKKRKMERDKAIALERKKAQMRAHVSIDRSHITSSKLMKRKEQIETELELGRGKTTLAEASRLHSELEVLDRAISRLSALGM